MVPIEPDLNVLAEPTAIIIACSLGISNSLERERGREGGIHKILLQDNSRINMVARISVSITPPSPPSTPPPPTPQALVAKASIIFGIIGSSKH